MPIGLSVSMSHSFVIPNFLAGVFSISIISEEGLLQDHIKLMTANRMLIFFIKLVNDFVPPTIIIQ